MNDWPPPLAVGAPARVEPAPRWVDPLAALRSIASRHRPVLLYSGPEAHPAARYSILAWDPAAEVTLHAGGAEYAHSWTGVRKVERAACGDPLGLLRSLLPVGNQGPGLSPFSGGAIGWLGYGLRRSIERLPEAASDPLRQPDAWFGIYDGALVFDHRERRTSMVVAPCGPEIAPPRQAEARAAGRMADLRQALDETRTATIVPDSPRNPAAVVARMAVPRGTYLAQVRRVLDLIAAGDLYQVNLSHRITCPLLESPLDLFLRLMHRNPSPFSAYLDAGPLQVVCASPERLVALRGDRARSSPIKGTRPRGAAPEEDRRLAEELLGSAKDRAENVMIADLVRNDLGRVCAPGSVRTLALCGLESFATVHHLVSTIDGRMRQGRDRFDLVRALFPGGSMTGAPKIRAMEVIAALEGEERGVYSGSLGYLSQDGGCDFNIVIRTIVCGDGRAHLRVGGGVVADSDPECEFKETLDKARALLEVLGAEVRTAG